MKKAVLGLGVIAGGLLYLSNKAKASVNQSAQLKALGEAAAQSDPLDPGMTGDQFLLWQRLMQLEGNPSVLRAQADGYRAAGFPNSANRILQKANLLSGVS